MGRIGLFRRHWLLAVVCGVLGATLAISVALFAVTPSYSATVKLYVSGTGAVGDDKWQNSEYARTHVASYADIINSNEVLEAVRDSLGLPQTREGNYSDLADDISAENPLQTLIIDVTVQDSSPQQAQAVAAAIGQVYNSVVAQLESPSSEKQSPVRISVVSPPALPTSPDSPNRTLYAAAGLIGGLLAGVGAAWLLELRSTMRRRPSGRDEASSDPWAAWHDVDSWGTTSETREPVEVLASPNGRGPSGNGAGWGTNGQRGSADS
jgi:succinoglycan biosynthesis transport protein ExoP